MVEPFSKPVKNSWNQPVTKQSPDPQPLRKPSGVFSKPQSMPVSQPSLFASGEDWESEANDYAPSFTLFTEKTAISFSKPETETSSNNETRLMGPKFSRRGHETEAKNREADETNPFVVPADKSSKYAVVLFWFKSTSLIFYEYVLHLEVTAKRFYLLTYSITLKTLCF